MDYPPQLSGGSGRTVCEQRAGIQRDAPNGHRRVKQTYTVQDRLPRPQVLKAAPCQLDVPGVGEGKRSLAGRRS
jgi:hypothetical protein